MMAASYETKAALELAVGEELRYIETSWFGEKYKPNGIFAVVGPATYQHLWYALVTVKDGLIFKVD